LTKSHECIRKLHLPWPCTYYSLCNKRYFAIDLLYLPWTVFIHVVYFSFTLIRRGTGKAELPGCFNVKLQELECEVKQPIWKCINSIRLTITYTLYHIYCAILLVVGRISILPSISTQMHLIYTTTFHHSIHSTLTAVYTGRFHHVTEVNNVKTR